VTSPGSPPVAMRPLTGADLVQLSRWLAAPHVSRWWQDPSGLQSVQAEYQPSIDGDDPTEVFIIEVAAARPA
jgi:aminoglycoside 6'-N-acetyltransferase